MMYIRIEIHNYFSEPFHPLPTKSIALLSLSKTKTMKISFIFPAVIAALLINITQAQRCPPICVAVFDPVCARDIDGDLKTFSNKCFFNGANFCKDKGSPFKLIGKGECPKNCPPICPKIFDPVCARSVDGEYRRFSNKCLFEGANRCKDDGAPFKLVSMKFCLPGCERSCSGVSKPLCAADVRGQLRSFASMCQLDNANRCKEPGAPFKKLRYGGCR
eukprot:Plantae.Rhodophyta-Hildenbrandia_rubra.ctg5458.p1 GENE.Plantae.Rhodophyta-Hildenbrandia_rubra.ctg5458~~Plantae.Rhodophyta-Hildenbrandia_rubra.ctg5458.p1  ORF type:complete len:218 (+),score=3.75 Plantae.Rhodophyta-Hildenbrandia_rubra.ctg5458:142-795(+)